MRLTKESGCFDETTIYTISSEPNRIFFKMNECVQKLGKLEDVEEALGMDLYTLFSALFLGNIWFINPIDGEITNSNSLYGTLSVDKQGLTLHSPVIDMLFEGKDYGKKWSIDKEDLENDDTL